MKYKVVFSTIVTVEAVSAQAASIQARRATSAFDLMADIDSVYGCSLLGVLGACVEDREPLVFGPYQEDASRDK